MWIRINLVNACVKGDFSNVVSSNWNYVTRAQSLPIKKVILYHVDKQKRRIPFAFIWKQGQNKEHIVKTQSNWKDVSTSYYL